MLLGNVYSNSGEGREEFLLRPYDGEQPLIRRRIGTGDDHIDRPCIGMLLMLQTVALLRTLRLPHGTDVCEKRRYVAEVLNKLTPLWDEMFPAERNRLMHLLLKKVTLYEDHLDLDIRTAGMEQILAELDYEDHD